MCPGSGKRLVPRDFNGQENVTLGGIGKRLAGEPGCELLPLLESGRDSVRDLAAHDMEIFGPAGRLEPGRADPRRYAVLYMRLCKRVGKNATAGLARNWSDRRIFCSFSEFFL